MESVLVHVTGDRIGDALIKWPAIAAFRKALPDCRLCWVAGRRQSVFAGPLKTLATGVIDEVFSANGLGVRVGGGRELLRGRSFDGVIVTETKIRPTLLLRAIPKETFIAPAANFLFSTRRPQNYPNIVSEQMRTLFELLLARKLEIENKIELPAYENDLANQVLSAEQACVGFAPGAAGVSKRWPLERFIHLAGELRSLGRPVFFLGPEERSWRDQIAHSLDDVLFPEYDPKGEVRGGPLLTIALARKMLVNIANDSGAGHLLAASGRPLVTLFGHTSAEKFKPPYCQREVVLARDYGGVEMARIPVAAVTRAVERALAANA